MALDLEKLARWEIELEVLQAALIGMYHLINGETRATSAGEERIPGVRDEARQARAALLQQLPQKFDQTAPTSALYAELAADLEELREAPSYVASRLPGLVSQARHVVDLEARAAALSAERDRKVAEMQPLLAIVSACRKLVGSKEMWPI